jgi:hypothetical protein
MKGAFFIADEKHSENAKSDKVILEAFNHVTRKEKNV